MAQVLLKRNFNTPFGRFKASQDGVPTDIPDLVLDRMDERTKAGLSAKEVEKLEKRGSPRIGLPLDAKIVGPDYRTPEELREEEAVNSVELTNAEIQAKINEEVNKRIAAQNKAVQAEKNKRTAERAVEAVQKSAPDQPIEEPATAIQDAVGHLVVELDRPIDQVAKDLRSMDYDDLTALLAAEEKGKARKTLLAYIQAAIDEFED